MRSERTPLAARLFCGALLCAVLGTLAGVLHNRAVERRRADPLVVVARTAVSVPAGILGRASRWVSEQTGWIFHGRAVAAENRVLRGRVDELEGEIASLREADTKYRQLRSDLAFVETMNPRPLAADVIGRRIDPKFDTIIISRGSRAGVRQNSIVETPAGLVGRVIDLTPWSASVLLLTDQTSGVGALVQRAESRIKGVCKGDNSALLYVAYLPNNADIRPGDTIVTSGLGGVFPAGVRIGAVRGVMADEGNLNKRATVQPAVDFDRLEQVYVLP